MGDEWKRNEYEMSGKTLAMQIQQSWSYVKVLSRFGIQWVEYEISEKVFSIVSLGHVNFLEALEHQLFECSTNQTVAFPWLVGKGSTQSATKNLHGLGFLLCFLIPVK